MHMISPEVELCKRWHVVEVLKYRYLVSGEIEDAQKVQVAKILYFRDPV